VAAQGVMQVLVLELGVVRLNHLVMVILVLLPAAQVAQGVAVAVVQVEQHQCQELQVDQQQAKVKLAEMVVQHF